jgi:ParB/Sulfiredoxin domain
MSQDELFQIMPPLSTDQEAALRASIEARGVVQPILVDQHGRIIDGHHRKRIADELGIDCPVELQNIASDDEGKDLAVELNAARRNLNERQTRQLIIEETERKPDESARGLAERIGCSHPTVLTVRRQLENGVPPEWIIERVVPPRRDPTARPVKFTALPDSPEPEGIIPGAAVILDPATGKPGLIEDRAMWGREFREAFTRKVGDRPADEAASHGNVSRAEWAAAQQVNFGVAVEYGQEILTMIDGGWLDKDTPDALRRLLWDLVAAVEDRVPRPDDDVLD